MFDPNDKPKRPKPQVAESEHVSPLQNLVMKTAAEFAAKGKRTTGGDFWMEVCQRLGRQQDDLLIACKAALNDRMYKDWPGIADLLIAAIAKAEGRS